MFLKKESFFQVIKRTIFVFTCILSICVFVYPSERVEAKSPSLSKIKLEIREGKSKYLKLQNNKKAVSWSIVSGKKNITLKNKSKKGVTVVGKKSGSAVIRAKVGTKKYFCSVKVKKIETSTKTYEVKISVGNHTLKAKLEDNSTTRALIGQMPMTISMMDLYGREMCYRYGKGAFPTDTLRSDRYEVGDIVYWPPAGSLVILYKQDGEQFERQQLGHIDSGVEIFDDIGDTDVTFELIK